MIIFWGAHGLCSFVGFDRAAVMCCGVMSDIYVREAVLDSMYDPVSVNQLRLNWDGHE